MNNNRVTLNEILKQYRADNNISDAEWYGLCRHYTRRTNANFDTIRYFLSPYYLQFPKELATDEQIRGEMLRFIEDNQ